MVPTSKLASPWFEAPREHFFCQLQLKILMCREWAETAVDPTSSRCQVQKPNL
jgi:hypothetical protein